MSKMSNHIVRQREAGIDVREDLTEEIIIVQSAVDALIHEYYYSEDTTKEERKELKELEEAWDKIKRSVKDDI